MHTFSSTIKLNVFICLSILYPLIAWSTTFSPKPISNQLDNSYGVLYGTFNGKDYKKLSSGEIVTEASFTIREMVGIEISEIVNKNNFKVMYPGGKWQDRDYNVIGTPTFKYKEEVVLLIKRGRYGFVLNNLGMGKYSVKYKGGKKYLISDIFPDNPLMGEFLFSDFEEKLIERFNEPLKHVNPDHSVKKQLVSKNYQHKNIAQGRSIASRSPASEKTSSENSRASIWGIVSLLVFLLGASIVMAKKKR